MLTWLAAQLYYDRVGLRFDALKHAYHAVVQKDFKLESIVPPVQERRSIVADISVHSAEELEVFFSRVEQLLDKPRAANEEPLISLVLHGPEVEYFALKNYEMHKALVDHAAKLAALGAVEISICQTQMKVRGIRNDEVPAFLEQVPYGPGEVERRVSDGYIRM